MIDSHIYFIWIWSNDLLNIFLSIVLNVITNNFFNSNIYVLFISI